jgi:hypothetical protein
MSTKAQELAAFIDRLQLRHFKGAEITAYATRKRGRVSNALPHESLWPNIVPTLIVADELREMLDVPLTITSAYRSPAYNAAVGGEPNSFHMRFMALDLIPQGATPRALAAAAKRLRGRTFKIPGTNDSFVFRGGIGTYNSFVHIDTRGRDANW